MTSYNTQIQALNRKHKQLTALACARDKLIGLPKVKFLVSPSGGSDKNREGRKQMIDAREEGVYMAPSSAPQMGTCSRKYTMQINSTLKL